MKKSVIYFVVFVVAFLASMGFIYYEANPMTRLAYIQEPQVWHGHVENQFGTYDGALIGDLFAGKGKFRFLAGETYVGEWEDSHMSGDGVLSFPGVGEYTGEMSNSMRNGQGVFVWDTGESYEGNWEKDEMSGSGIYIFSDGSMLTGEYQHNKPVSGTLKFTTEANDEDPDASVISLEYTFSDKTKTIVFTTKGGLVYDGDLSGLVGSGSAKITYPSGNTYNGGVSKGLRNGTGTYEWKDDSNSTIAYYDGSWSSDHMNGSGKYHYTGSEYPFLSGSFENDVPSGTLVYYKAAGNTFETMWENGTCVSVKEK